MHSGVEKERVCLIGAGYIASVHAEALRQLEIPVSAVVDTNKSAAERFAARWGVTSIFTSFDDALATGGFERAHILVPPDRHCAMALEGAQSGKAVLVEKPICVSGGEARSLVAAQTSPIGVNQNFVYHPAFTRLVRSLERREFGKPHFVNLIYHAPLRQMAARQFGHWMFREPKNILFEQAIHPLSQVQALCGIVESVEAIAESPIAIAPGVDFVQSFTASLRCARLPASMRFMVGASYPFWQVQVLCDDGVLACDVLQNRFWTYGRTRWMDAIDGLISGQRSAARLATDSWKSSLNYVLSTAKLKPRSDGFFQSMLGSLAAFHKALDQGDAPPLDAAFGAQLVETCEKIAEQIIPRHLASADVALSRKVARLQKPDVAVLGGTGFIGTSLVKRLREQGLSVSVMARNTANLAEIFHGSEVEVHRGDTGRAEDVERAISGARFVVNLAHGGGGDSWEAIHNAMVGGAETVARACARAGTERLIHVGSIAGLYLGPQAGLVTGETPPDPKPERRGDYARAKVLCDLRLLEMQEKDGLPVCILRPGLVVGEGTSPFHSGVGFYNNEQHCIGWNAGLNPLPFVLVDDVAQAIHLALTAEDVVGRCYNLVGDVRPGAREYITELARGLDRPLKFHPKSPYTLYGEEFGKWIIKRATGRSVPPPSLRDFLSRGLTAQFDCSDAKRDLGWNPVGDKGTFTRLAISVHASS